MPTLRFGDPMAHAFADVVSGSGTRMPDSPGAGMVRTVEYRPQLPPWALDIARLCRAAVSPELVASCPLCGWRGERPQRPEGPVPRGRCLLSTVPRGASLHLGSPRVRVGAPVSLDRGLQSKPLSLSRRILGDNVGVATLWQGEGVQMPSAQSSRFVMSFAASASNTAEQAGVRGPSLCATLTRCRLPDRSCHDGLA